MNVFISIFSIFTRDRAIYSFFILIVRDICVFGCVSGNWLDLKPLLRRLFEINHLILDHVLCSYSTAFMAYVFGLKNGMTVTAKVVRWFPSVLYTEQGLALSFAIVLINYIFYVLFYFLTIKIITQINRIVSYR